MPSSYSSRLRLELQATGENAGLWGTVLNNQAGTLIESAIAGYRTVALPDANYTLSALNGADDESRYAFITFTGTLSAQRTITVPTASKIYRVLNTTNQPLTIKTASGTGVDIPVSASTTLYSNGVNVLNAMNFIANLTSTTVSTGTLFVSGALTATAATFSGQITSTVPDGTAPFSVVSTTPVTNLSIGGNASTATTLQTARNINGVSFNGSANITVTANTPNSLSLGVSGTGLSGSATFDGSAATSFTVASNATSANTASTLVSRDASGNFSAGTITAALSGNATSATSATTATNAGTATNQSGGTVSATTGAFSDTVTLSNATPTISASASNADISVFNTGVVASVSAFGTAAVVNIGNTTATTVQTFAGGATVANSTKNVAIGTGGVANSTTSILIGPSAGASTIQLRGQVIANGDVQAPSVGSSSGDFLIQTAGTEVARATTAGNFGFGTTAPTSKLHALLSSTPAATGNMSGTIFASSSSTLPGVAIGASATFGWIQSGFSNAANVPADLRIYTGATEKARITSGGNLLVGQTVGVVFGARHEATGDVAGQFRTPAPSGTGIAIACVRTASTGGEQIRFCVNDSTTGVGNINSTATATSFNTSSDYRLKNNQQLLTGSGAFIDSLMPKTWEWFADGSKGVGFIAHEVQAVSPQSVTGEKDAVDDEGKPVYQAMEYGSAEFIANIVAELQSVRKRLAALEAK